MYASWPQKLKSNRSLRRALVMTQNMCIRKVEIQSLLQSKVVPKVQKKGEGFVDRKQTSNSSTSSCQKCFKCHGFRHIASDCPNRIILTLVEDHSDREGDEGRNELEFDDEEEEVTCADHGMSIVVQWNLKMSFAEEDESWVRMNVFHTKSLLMAGCAWLSLIVAALRINVIRDGLKAQVGHYPSSKSLPIMLAAKGKRNQGNQKMFDFIFY